MLRTPPDGVTRGSPTANPSVGAPPHPSVIVTSAPPAVGCSTTAFPAGTSWPSRVIGASEVTARSLPSNSVSRTEIGPVSTCCSSVPP